MDPLYYHVPTNFLCDQVSIDFFCSHISINFLCGQFQSTNMLSNTSYGLSLNQYHVFEHLNAIEVEAHSLDILVGVKVTPVNYPC